MLTISTSKYEKNGVHVYSGSDRIRVVYDGLLPQSGATDVYARVGFGANWSNLYDYKMHKTSTGFEAVIPIQPGESPQVAFKDCANNWDNNSGENYHLLQKPAVATRKSPASAKSPGRQRKASIT